MNLPNFFKTYGPWVNMLAWCAGILLMLGSVWGLLFAPIDYLQGNSYRIMFIHVPFAMLAMSLYLFLGISGVIQLVWKIKVFQLLSQAAAPVGLVFCVLALVTGSIWGKPTWGAYWVWDARLTSMLLLAFLYAGVIALNNAYVGLAQQGNMSAILAIIGCINLPIIKYSVVWWNTLHQGATFSLTQAPKMPASMYAPLIIMVLGFYSLAISLTIYRTCTLILKREQYKAWVRDMLKEK
jgi:heme exporter protein C